MDLLSEKDAHDKKKCKVRGVLNRQCLHKLPIFLSIPKFSEEIISNMRKYYIIPIRSIKQRDEQNSIRGTNDQRK